MSNTQQAFDKGVAAILKPYRPKNEQAAVHTGVNPKPGTKRRLDNPAERELLWNAMLDLGGVTKACDSLGLNRNEVWRKRIEEKEFADQFDAALASVSEKLLLEANELADELAECDHDTVKARWCAVKMQIDTRLRIAGKLMPKKYGDEPTAVNIGVAVGITCTEEQRKRLIELREEIQDKTKELMM